MAQGDLTLFEEFRLKIADGTHDLDTDSFKASLHNAIPSAAASNPGYSGTAGTDLTLTEVSGTGYTAGGVALTTTYTEAAGTATFDSSVNPSWTQDGAGPTDIRALVVYNDSATNKEAIGYVDLTTDGSTPISLQDGDITVTWNASGIFTLA